MPPDQPPPRGLKAILCTLTMPKTKKKSSYGGRKTKKARKAERAAKHAGTGGGSLPSAQEHAPAPAKKSATAADAARKPSANDPDVAAAKTTRSSKNIGVDAIIADDNGALALAAEVLFSLPRDLWWRTLQCPDGGLDLSSGSRQSWSVIVPVYLKAGLYTPPNIDQAGSFKLQYVKKRWDELKLFMEYKHNTLIEIEPMERKGISISHHVRVCDGKPKFNSAFQQLKAVAKKGLDAIGLHSLAGTRRNTRRNDHDDTEMREKLEEFRAQFHDEFVAFARKKIEGDEEMMEAVRQYAAEIMGEARDEAQEQERSDAADTEPRDGGGDADVGTTTMGSAVDERIASALALDLDIRPRPRRDGNGTIEVHERKQTTERQRYLAVTLAKLWGHDNPSLTYKQRRKIEQAACQQIAYDHGFKKSTGGHMLKQWEKKLKSGVASGETAPLTSQHKGSRAKTDEVDEQYPGYLHELYRYAINTAGIKATFNEIAESMNMKSQNPTELRPALSLHYKQVYRWWHKNGGKERSPFEKPSV